jgi:hypothetical protein
VLLENKHPTVKSDTDIGIYIIWRQILGEKNVETQLDWTSSKSDQFTTYTLTMAKWWFPYRTVKPLPFDFHSVARLPYTLVFNGNRDATTWPDKKHNQQFKVKYPDDVTDILDTVHRLRLTKP